MPSWKPVETLVSAGRKREPTNPTGPSHRSWLTASEKPRSRSDAKVLLIASVVHAVRPGFFACSISNEKPEDVIDSNRILRPSSGWSPAGRVVSPSGRGGGRSLASKFCDRPMVMACRGSLRRLMVPPRETARAYASGTVAAGE